MRLADYISFTLALSLSRISYTSFKSLDIYKSSPIRALCSSPISRVIELLSEKLYLRLDQKDEITCIMNHKALHLGALCGYVSLNESDKRSRIQEITNSALFKIKAVLLPEQRVIFDDTNIN